MKPPTLSMKLGVPMLVHPKMCQDLMKLVECMEDDGPQHVELTPRMRVLKRQGQIITTRALGTNKSE
jgi:hypothetical protein